MADDSSHGHSLQKWQLIDYRNVAAGHDGVLASQSGDLIVKPCKNQEVLFYKSTWTSDPDPSEFAYYMPKFYGTLNLQEHPPASPSLPSAAAAAAAAATAASSPTATASQTGAPPALHSPTTDRRPNHVPSLSAPGTPKSSASKSGHGRSPSRTSIISHLPVDESLAPTKPPKTWEPTHGAKIKADTAVVLEDVAAGLHKPNILDVKIGARLWADDAHPAKRQKLDKVAKETTSGILGFRIAGMKVWAGDGAYERENRKAMDRGGGNVYDQQGTTVESETHQDRHGLPLPSLRDDDYASYDREYGRSMSVDSVRYGFEEFFFRPQAGVRPSFAREVISRFAEDLRGLIEVMAHMETRMYSASLLFVYEGNGGALRDDFRREDRILREIRLQHEAAKAGVHDIALDGDVTTTSTREHHSNLTSLVEAVTGSRGGGAAPQLVLTEGLQLRSKSTGLQTLVDTSALSSSNISELPGIQTALGHLDMPDQLLVSDGHLAEPVMTDLSNLQDQGGDDYDDDDDDEGEEDDEGTLPKIQAMKVIDFAHASWTPGQGPDENFLHGVRNVLQVLESMLEEDDE